MKQSHHCIIIQIIVPLLTFLSFFFLCSSPLINKQIQLIPNYPYLCKSSFLRRLSQEDISHIFSKCANKIKEEITKKRGLWCVLSHPYLQFLCLSTMADRVYPMDLPSSSNPPSSNNSGEVVLPKKPSFPSPAKPIQPPAGTYVVQVPKDQIYKYPPPENSRRYESLTKRKPSRSFCCRCLCFTFSVLLLLIISIGITAGVLYLVYRPEAPKYTISSIAIKNFNVTTSSKISPEFDISVRAENPNNKLGIYYRKGSSVTVVYSGVDLSAGVLPAFYQPANNVTVFQTALKGSNVVLGNAVKSTLKNEQRKGKVPFRVNIKAPVKIKIGAVKTWKIIVKVNCDLTADVLTIRSKLVSKDCDYSVRLW